MNNINFVCKVENDIHSLAICNRGKLYFWFTGKEPESYEIRFQNEFIKYLYLNEEVVYLITDKNIIYVCNISGKVCTTSLYERDVNKLLFPTNVKIEKLKIVNNIIYIRVEKKTYAMKNPLFCKFSDCKVIIPELIQD